MKIFKQKFGCEIDSITITKLGSKERGFFKHADIEIKIEKKSFDIGKMYNKEGIK